MPYFMFSEIYVKNKQLIFIDLFLKFLKKFIFERSFQPASSWTSKDVYLCSINTQKESNLKDIKSLKN